MGSVGTATLGTEWEGPLQEAARPTLQGHHTRKAVCPGQPLEDDLTAEPQAQGPSKVRRCLGDAAVTLATQAGAVEAPKKRTQAMEPELLLTGCPMPLGAQERQGAGRRWEEERGGAQGPAEDPRGRGRNCLAAVTTWPA